MQFSQAHEQSLRRAGLAMTAFGTANALPLRRGLEMLDGAVHYLAPALITAAVGVWLYVLLALAAG